MNILTHHVMPLIALAAGLTLSGCIEESTVIKVRRDGSGIIHERSYSASTANVIPLPDLSGDKQAGENAEQEEPKLPSEAALREYAKTLGTGVTFTSVKAATNKKGWKGYEILYQFDDINTVRYARKTPKPESAQPGDEDKEKKDNKADDLTATFAMKDGKLSIRMESEAFLNPQQAPAQAPDSPTIDPYADAAGPGPAAMGIASPAMNESMMKAVTKGMRMGVFLQVEGEIADTNAAHRNGNLITLFNADLGTMLENEGATATLNRLETVDRAGFQQLADELDGFDIDLQDPIVVRIK